MTRVEAEQFVLALLLCDPQASPAALARLRADLFAHAAHLAIAEAICALRDGGQLPTADRVRALLAGGGLLPMAIAEGRTRRDLVTALVAAIGCVSGADWYLAQLEQLAGATAQARPKVAQAASERPGEACLA